MYWENNLYSRAFLTSYYQQELLVGAIYSDGMMKLVAAGYNTAVVKYGIHTDMGKNVPIDYLLARYLHHRFN